MSLPLFIVAGFFAVMGSLGLFAPGRLTAIFGLRELTPDTRNEVRAAYGGFALALAGLLLYVSPGDPLRDGILFTVSVACAGMASGRVIGALIETPGRWPVVFFIAETALGVLSWTAMGGR
jgi:Domain of unknown function (DUF4345)